MVKTNLNEVGYFVFISLRNHLNVRFVKQKKIYDEAKTFLKLNSQRTSFRKLVSPLLQTPIKRPSNLVMPQ